jgi:pimeloyl-ACP methyl ester carboxylesterase
LVHGYTRNLQADWVDTGIFEKLAAAHRVIAIDLRGHGKSGKPPDPAVYLDDVHLDVVIRLMNYLNISRAHMVGYSAGCTVVGRLAIAHP